MQQVKEHKRKLRCPRISGVSMAIKKWKKKRDERDEDDNDYEDVTKKTKEKLEEKKYKPAKYVAYRIEEGEHVPYDTTDITKEKLIQLKSKEIQEFLKKYKPSEGISDKDAAKILKALAEVEESLAED